MTHAHHVRGAATIVALLLLLPGTLSAQSSPAAIEKLTERADIVAIGRVQQMKSEWNEQRTSIRTRIMVSVEEYLKGSAGSSFDLFVPGGEVDGVGELYTHTARFEKDEEVVVFAEKDKMGRHRVSGGSEGKLRVTKDERAKTRVVANLKRLEDLSREIKGFVRARQVK
jgi:hypothetical protein